MRAVIRNIDDFDWRLNYYTEMFLNLTTLRCNIEYNISLGITRGV